jgi:DNA-binding XRE family transcriptional regulator
VSGAALPDAAATDATQAFYDEIAVAVRACRWRAEMTQAQLARAVGCHRVTIAQLECGRWHVSLPLLRAIAATLRVSVRRLIPR